MQCFNALHYSRQALSLLVSLYKPFDFLPLTSNAVDLLRLHLM